MLVPMRAILDAADKNGYAQGALTRQIMDDIVEQTRTGQRR